MAQDLGNDPEERQHTVLVVDDEDNMRIATQRVLKRAGYIVEQASTGDEALRLAREQNLSVIISDIRMPGMDGHTLLRRLHAQGTDAPVVLTSGLGTMEDVVEGVRHGAIDYLKKPWTPAELLSVVARAVDTFEQREKAKRGIALAERVATAAASASSATSPPDAPSPPSAARARGAAAESAAGDTTSSSSKTFAALLERMRRGEFPLPSAPAVVIELRQKMNDPSATLESLVALLERDPHLTAEVLRVSNGVLYRGVTRVTNLQMAVARLGIKHLHHLVETVFARRLFEVPKGPLHELVARIWALSVSRAVFMRAIAEQLQGPVRLDSGAAYVAGLLCDAGASFLVRVLAELDAPTTDPHARLEWLQKMHATVGARILFSWKLDEAVVKLVAHHHDATPPTPPNPYYSVCALASSLAEETLAQPDDTRPAGVQPRERMKLLDDLRLTAAVVDPIKERLQPEITALIEAFE